MSLRFQKTMSFKPDLFLVLTKQACMSSILGFTAKTDSGRLRLLPFFQALKQSLAQQNDDLWL